MQGVEVATGRRVVGESVCANGFDDVMRHAEYLVFVPNVVAHEPLVKLLHTQIRCEYISYAHRYIYTYTCI